MYYRGNNKPKYGNKKVEYNNIKFDSKKELNFYLELLEREKRGEVKDIQLQKTFVLQPSFKFNGKTIRAITYRADFVYYDNTDNKEHIVDVKSPGTITEVFKIKRKLMLYLGNDLEVFM